MTPEYASPEQVKRRACHHRERRLQSWRSSLRTVKWPFSYRFKTLLPEEIASVISDCEPEKPSSVINRVEEVTTGGRKCRALTPESVSETREGRPESCDAGWQDLDNIVLLAMRKEPLRRYSSVGQFSEDIRRHLEGYR